MFEQLASVPDAELLAAVAELEVELSRLRYRQLAVLAELNNRNVPATLGFRGLADLIAAQARCTTVEARKRTRAVQRFGARRSLTGEPLQPVYPDVAEALAVGEVGSEHAAEIAEVVEAIPQPDRAEHAGHVEATLLEHARTSDPRTVRLLGRRILAHLDPDGPSPDEQRQQQTHRGVSLTPLADGSGVLEGRLSPACLAIWQAILTPLAACRPDDALGPDDRTIGQRWHDAFEEAGRRLLAAGALPEHAGLPSQLIITISLSDLERRAGRATTHHGGTLTINDALRLAADGKMLPAILNDTGGILAYGHGRRLAAPGQRRALFARDRGCTFPGLHPHCRPVRDPSRPRLGQRRQNRPGKYGYRVRLPQHGGAPKRLADGADRRHPTLATTQLAPNQTTTTQLPPPPRTTQNTARIAGAPAAPGLAAGADADGETWLCRLDDAASADRDRVSAPAAAGEQQQAEPGQQQSEGEVQRVLGVASGLSQA